MNRWILAACALFVATGCSAFRGPGPTKDEVGKVFSWKLKDTVSVAETGCPAEANVESLKQNLPDSYMFVRLDSLTAATNMDCRTAFDMESCIEIEEETAVYFPRSLTVDGATFTGNVESVVKELVAGCALKVTSTLALEDEGNHGTLNIGMTFHKDQVPACDGVQLAGPDNTPVEQCDVDVSGELTLINVGEAP